MKNKNNNTAYIYSISLIGIIVSIFLVLSSPPQPIMIILVIGLFAAVAESLSVPIAGRYISVSSAIILCAVISYGPMTAAIASIISILFKLKRDPDTGKYEHLFNTSHKRTLFNCAMLSLSSTASSYAYLLLGGDLLFQTSRMFNGDISKIFVLVSEQSLFIIAAIVTDMFVNTLLMAGYFHTSGRGQILQEWIHEFFWSFAGLLVVGFMGVLITVFYLSYNWFIVLIIFSPLFLARYTFSLYSNLRESYMETIKTLSRAIDAKDPYTKDHSERVQEYSALIASELHLSPKQQEIIQYAALLHDIGKIGVPELILNKPGKLDLAEFDSIKLHPVLGASIISNVKYLKECVPIVKYHHKYYDGSGYPDIAPGETVPYESYILCVADAYDAMTSKRQYHEPLSAEHALEEIVRCTGTQFDPTVSKAFIHAIANQTDKAKLMENANIDQYDMNISAT